MMNNSLIILNKPQKGFSVGEVVIAAFVLSVGIVSVIGLITFSYRQSSESQKLIIASELAQEGVELVRNVRDEEMAAKADSGSSSNILDSLHSLSNKNQCRIDYDDGAVSCGVDATAGLKLSGGFYVHSNTGQDEFYRRIKIDGDTTNGLRVYSFVTWTAPIVAINTGTPNQAMANCTLATSCVYTEHFLTPWK